MDAVLTCYLSCSGADARLGRGWERGNSGRRGACARAGRSSGHGCRVTGCDGGRSGGSGGGGGGGTVCASGGPGEGREGESRGEGEAGLPSRALFSGLSAGIGTVLARIVPRGGQPDRQAGRQTCGQAVGGRQAGMYM